MKLHDLQPAPGSKKERIRVGRGHAAGKGKTAGKGTKGQKVRRQGEIKPYFEGGQLPLVRRLPHTRGFINLWKTYYKPVNLARLTQFAANSVVDPAALAQAGIIREATEPVVVLGSGELDRPLVVKAHRFSASAKQKIEAAGGTVEVLAS